MKHLAFGLPALFLFFALAGCAGDDGEGKEVEVDDDYFEVDGNPNSKNGDAAAKVGDTFTFENEGQRVHSVTVHRPPDAATTTIKDTDVQPGQDTSLSFDKAGVYHVWCKYHGSMGAGMHLNVTVSA